MQSILVSGARNRVARSVSGFSDRGGLGSKLRWSKLMGGAAKGTTPDVVNLSESRGKAFVVKAYDSCPFRRYEDVKAWFREVEERSISRLTIKSEEEEKMRMEFDRWAAKYGRVYSSKEKEKRFRIFAKRLMRINEYKDSGDMKISEIATGDLPDDTPMENAEEVVFFMGKKPTFVN